MTVLAIVLCLALAIAGCGGGGSTTSSPESEATADAPGPEVPIPAGSPPKKLVVKVLKQGTGRKLGQKDEFSIEYVGKRWNGEAYSNSWTYNGAPSFHFGEHRLTPGLEQALLGMRAGTRSLVIVPPKLIHYANERVTPADLRPVDTLVFMLELVAVK